MSYSLLENPWIAAPSLLVAIAALGNSFSAPFGIEPFWADCVVLAVLAGALIHWALYLRASVARAAETHDLFTSRSAAIRSSLRSAIRSSFFVPLILGLSLTWTIKPLVNHLLRSQSWELCATFTGTCKQGDCVVLLDTRKRRLGDCHEPLDDSGYFRLRAAGFDEYRPAYAQSCTAQDAHAIRLPESVFGDHCSSVVDIR